MTSRRWAACLSLTLCASLPLGCGRAFGQEVQENTERAVVNLDFAASPSEQKPIGLKVGGKAKLDSSSLVLAGGHADVVDAEPLIRRLKSGRGLSLEVWLKTSQLKQKGPARIVTISGNSSQRNLTLGQEGERLHVRFRTSKTGANGLSPLVTSKVIKPDTWLHVVYSRRTSGEEAIFVSGKRVASGKRPGSTADWRTNYGLRLGDELGGGRAWRGQLRSVQILATALNESQVIARFRAGPGGQPLAKTAQSRSHFETTIAPLLADRCLECHDTATRDGGLDLSTQLAMRAGGDSGDAIVAGNAEASSLIELVRSGEMPAGREALSDEEIAELEKWIDDGAEFTLAAIDPAIYAHGGGDSQRWLARLTKQEYITTVRYTLGVDIASEAEKLLPDDLRADGFTNTTYNLAVDLQHIEAYATLAEEIVKKLDVGRCADRFAKNRKFTDKDMGALIEKMGAWILRGPLDEDETIIFRGISTSVAAAGGTYDEAVGLIVEAMLQSPRFIYRVEDQRGDGRVWPVSQYELASRLSYMLWGGPPDEALMHAAKEGTLYVGDDLEQQVDRMLDDPKAADRAEQFIAEWLNLRGLKNLQPDSERFPGWSVELAEDMRRETIAYFRHVALDLEKPLSSLLNHPVVFASDRLAGHYGLAEEGKSPKTKQASNLHRYDAPKSGRGGILTQGSVLTIGGDNASMVSRGLFVLHDLLRGVVKDPPPCVNTTPVPTRPGLTQRDIASQRISSEACGGCHRRFEPLAFGLERFDGLGTFATVDQYGNELRQDGQVLVPGKRQPIKYESVRELMDALAAQPRVQQSLTWKLIQFAIGRPPGAADAKLVDQIYKTSSARGGTYRDVMRATALSDLILLHRTESVSK